jgi:hypothetical protein
VERLYAAVERDAVSKGKYRAKDQQEHEATQAILDEATRELGQVLARLPDGPVSRQEAKPPQSLPFCINCTHHRTIPPMHYCGGAGPNLVTGQYQELPCEEMRATGQCGPEGKLFEQAPPAEPEIKYEG